MNDTQYQEITAALSGLSVLVRDLHDGMQVMKADITNIKADIAHLKITIERHTQLVMQQMSERIEREEHLSSRMGRLARSRLETSFRPPVRPGVDRAGTEAG